jgi:hypothetical protein
VHNHRIAELPFAELSLSEKPLEMRRYQVRTQRSQSWPVLGPLESLGMDKWEKGLRVGRLDV